MSVVAWRIIQRKFAKRAFRAEGARFFGGRWNSPGHAVVYTAQSLALAALELLVNVDSDKLLQDYVAIPVTVDPQLITKVDKSAPPNNWRAYPASKATRTIGDEWISEGVLPVLQVPSAVIPTEFNFLPNPSHTEFRKLRIGKPQRFRFDRRLTDKIVDSAGPRFRLCRE